MKTVAKTNRGVFNPTLRDAVIRFQEGGIDPQTKAPLVDDGTVGMSDTRALFTPLILDAESSFGIPDRLLLGETNHESQIEPGALGYFIYYPDYRGVDRGVRRSTARRRPAPHGWRRSTRRSPSAGRRSGCAATTTSSRSRARS